MCGRYSLIVDGEELWEELGLEGEPPELPRRYNVAPSQEVPAVVDRYPRELRTLRWGLVPFWAKDPSIGHRMVNARAETVPEKPAFRRAFERRRCLVPADGFYEWRRDGKRKTPFRVRLRSGRPFTFAGLWETWRDPEDRILRTCVILTTEPTEGLRSLHDRMPLILPPEARGTWLDREAPREALLPLLDLRPSDETLDVYEVSPVVGSPQNDVPACVEPVR